MPYDPPPELAGLSLSEIAALAQSRRLPPLDQWSPAHSGESHMRIQADGTWLHEGSPITRPAMVRAFATLLMRDADAQHWLVTPHERLAIAVDDAALIAIDMGVRHDPATGEAVLAFRLNTDDIVLCGPEHPLRVAGTPDVPAFYLAVRHGVEARLNRSTYGQLVAHALDVSPPEALGVSSRGAHFALVPPA
ncbi:MULTISPECIES: DUF1285 domain-containing protein [unclassified Sphingomonas]|uniref:DUF1285 domain-containing protein n=1 Tax=Novosphingobium rhizosphaerae TaxID=1551649 RepID=UPI0015C74C06